MEIENVKEYEYIRSETELIRSCITTYMGHVIGGSGAAMFGLAALRLFSPENRVAVGFVSFATSVIVTLVLAILFYKFNSHNRYAAYSLVLADETYEKKPAQYPSHDASHVAWELCMERIRMADRRPDSFRDLANIALTSRSQDGDAAVQYKWMLDQYLPRDGRPPVDANKFWFGVKHLVLALFGKTKTISWAFPPPVVAVFFVLTAIYFSIGAYSTITYGVDNWDKLRILDATDTPFFMLVAVAVTVFLVQNTIWRILSGKLFTIMSGSATVNAFAVRFAVARSIYLYGLGVVPKYLSIESLLREERSRMEAIAAIAANTEQG